MSDVQYALRDLRVESFSSTYIALNAGKFLDDTWVNVGLFREYVQRTAQTSTVDASRTHSSSFLDSSHSTHIQIEVPPPVLPFSIKAEPETISLHQPPQCGDVKMRVLTEDGHEVLELLSDSDEDEDLNSDQEVIDAFRRTSRSSSILAPSIPDSTVYDDIDGVFGGGPSYDDQNSAQLTNDDVPAEDDSSAGMSNGHQYFVACSRWTKQFKDNHRTHTIPDQVDEHLLIKALARQPLTDDKTKDTPPCSAIIHTHL
ncbi:hypothetical protein K438DRAFT_1960610 [Mycena galopus ATCC 62051]|nr:hypothetical protein K438DRAFT_1960610 [Mycena galopus ATCC 62051]